MEETIEEFASDLCEEFNKNEYDNYYWLSMDSARTIVKGLIAKGYRKESDTAREILTLIKNGVELNSMIDGDAKIAIMNELRWAGQRYGIDFTNSLEKGGDKNGKTSSRS